MSQRVTFAITLLGVLAGSPAPVPGQAASVSVRAAHVATPAVTKPLDIYVVDTEGGKATLFVSPSGETVLIDAGNPGTRDLDRILEVVAVAGVTTIDYLISTHYHGDHVGGLPELAKRIPIRHFMDHGANIESPEQVRGFQAAYEELYRNATHTVLKPGDRVPVAGLDWRIVMSAGRAITSPLAGGGQTNAAECASFQRTPDASSPDDNSQSVGSVITLGRFRAIDLGDLLWNNEFDLVCPRNQIGPIDLYLVTHHGLDRSGSPALVRSIRPRVAVMQNGTRKGGAPATFQTLRSSSGLEDIWTLHWAYASGIEHNSAGVFIANIDDMPTIAGILNPPPPPPPDTPGTAPAPRPGGAGGARGNQAHTPAYWIKVSALADGSFTVTNSRNGFSKRYAKR